MQNRFETRHAVTLKVAGYTLIGCLHMPLSIEKPVPGVVICHGFAGNKIGHGRIRVLQAEELARRGVAALRVDFVGCGDSEGHSLDICLENQVESATEAFRFLEEYEGVDGARLGILGASMGGLIAVRAAAAYEKTKSVALWAALSNTESWQRDWMEACKEEGMAEIPDRLFYQDEWVSRHFIEQFLQVDIAEAMKSLLSVDMLHIHGESDELVSIEHADVYEGFRENSTGKNSFVRLPEADHSFSREEDRQSAVQVTADWFVETLA